MKLILPVSLERTLTLEGRFPIVEEEWDRMLAVLESMRPGLVVARSSRTEREDEEPF